MLGTVLECRHGTTVSPYTTESIVDWVAFCPKFRPVTVIVPPSLATLLTLSMTGGIAWLNMNGAKSGEAPAMVTDALMLDPTPAGALQTAVNWAESM